MILFCTCGNYNFLNYNDASFDLSHLYIHKHVRAHIHTHTHTHTHIHAHAKSSFFNENIRPNKDSGQTEKNKLKFCIT